MKNLFLFAAAVFALAGCATTNNSASNDEPAEMPEYTTGSIIAQKSKAAKPAAVKTASSEALSEIQRASSIEMH